METPKYKAHHMGHIVRHEGGAIFVWGCMPSLGMGYMCKIKGEMTHTLYLSILHDEVLKTIDRYR